MAISTGRWDDYLQGLPDDIRAFMERERDKDQPTCPYCHHRDEEWLTDNNGTGHLPWGDPWEHECPNCERTYNVTREVQYTSEEIEGGEDEEE